MSNYEEGQTLIDLASIDKVEGRLSGHDLLHRQSIDYHPISPQTA